MLDTVLNTVQIQNILPHRYPFLLVDRIVEIVPGKRAVGIKNVTINEEFFCGHFPGAPVMPGVLILEAMAQVGGILVLSDPRNKGKLAMFASLDKVRFHRPVMPGDSLRIEVEVLKMRARFYKVYIKTFVEDHVVVEGEFMCAVADREEVIGIGGAPTESAKNVNP